MTPDAFGFGGEPALADELAALVISGRKRATTSLAIEFTADGDPLPRTGDISVVVDGRGEPAVIIERTDVSEIPFGRVGADYAAVEGEGDGTLSHWRQVHEQYFHAVCTRLGGHFDADTPVLCQTFRVLWQAGSGHSR